MKRLSRLSIKILCMALALLMLSAALAGCGGQEPTAEPAQPVTLLVAGAWEDCRAIEAVGREFTAAYPNCTVEYEYLQDYEASLLKRMSGDEAVDLFFTNNIQSDSERLPYALNIFSRDDIDLSGAHSGLIANFRLFGEGGEADSKLYAVPLGAEMRGMYVNKTLLDSLGIPMPTEQASFLAACKTLAEAGYIPLHGNPGSFAQTLIYPWVCNLIANAPDPQAAYDKVNNKEPGLGEMFKEPFEFLYSLVESGYYDYKRAQTDESLFLDTTDEAYARDFLSIRQNGEVYEKLDDVGRVAFLPSAMSLRNTVDKVKDDYHSEIEYVFMPAPIGPEGGFVYMSPSTGIAINKGSENLDWAAKFLSFLFMPENNRIFAEEFDIIPNTADALDYINQSFDVPDDRVSQLGQVTFDYGFYNIITEALLNISKGNNPKYMQENADGSAAMYPLQYYVDAFEEGIAQDGK